MRTLHDFGTGQLVGLFRAIILTPIIFESALRVEVLIIFTVSEKANETDN